MSMLPRIIRNFGYLAFGRVLGDLLVFVLIVVLSRSFGQEGVGQYSFAVAFTSIFGVLADFGLYQLAIKELARREENFGALYTEILALRIGLASGSLLVIVAAMIIASFPRELVIIIACVGLYQLASRLVEGITAALVARQEAWRAGLTEAFLRGGSAIAAIAVVVLGGELVLASAMLPVVAVAVFIVGQRFIAKNYRVAWSSVGIGRLWRLGRAAWPFAVPVVIFSVYSRLDVVIVGAFAGMAAAGVYNVANRVIIVLLFLAQFISTAIFPIASKLHGESGENRGVLVQRSMQAAVLIALPMAGGVWLIAPTITLTLFGDDFRESAFILRVLVGALALGFLNRMMGMFLMAGDLQTARAKAYVVAGVVSVSANLTLVPLLGGTGAAISAVCAEAVLFAIFVTHLRVLTDVVALKATVWKAALGVGLFVVPFAVSPSSSAIMVVPVAVAVYVLVLAIFPDTRQMGAEAIGGLRRAFSGEGRRTVK